MIILHFVLSLPVDKVMLARVPVHWHGSWIWGLALQTSVYGVVRGSSVVVNFAFPHNATNTHVTYRLD
jgi:hypothetical protein